MSPTALFSPRPTTPAEELARLRLLWIAFLVAVGAYTPLPFLIVHDGLDPAAPLPAGVRSAMQFAAAGAAVSSLAAKRWWSHSLLAAARAASATPARAGVWARLRAGCVITWALSEAVALIGLALALVAHRPVDALPAAGVAALLLYVHRPATWPLGALVPNGRAPT